MNSSPKQNIKKSKIQLLHQYYSYTGFYTFVRTSLKKEITPPKYDKIASTDT